MSPPRAARSPPAALPPPTAPPRPPRVLTTRWPTATSSTAPGWPPGGSWSATPWCAARASIDPRTSPFPVTDEVCGLRDGGCYQRFQREDGHIYFSPASGAWSVQGAIFGHWASTGWEAGWLGYPVGPESCRDLPDARECVQNFLGGEVVWNSRFGTRG
ncbi:hypothetical protein HJ590_17170 [Naumannella sp. ID2617S]|nr:hypothetical protein [Naumannella sp. ID2617S]